MSKTTAHVVLLFIDILVLLFIWMAYDEIRQVVAGIAHSADSVEFNSKMGFVFIGVAVLIVHFFSVYEHFWPNTLEKKGAIINWSLFALLIFLFVCGFSISFSVERYVKQAGYLHCHAADNGMTFSVNLVYTKDESICSQMIADRKRRY